MDKSLLAGLAIVALLLLVRVGAVGRIWMFIPVGVKVLDTIATCEQLVTQVGRIINFFRNLFQMINAWLHAGPERFTLAEMRLATNNFAHKIGQGDSGKVYEGKLPDGRPVAVKRLRDSQLRRAEDTFDKELALLRPVRHEHIVRLVGSCAEERQRILVYEHMDGGTLRDLLDDESPVAPPPSWRRRVKVLLGAARGIKHLHCHAVIHGNVTSSNILLGRTMAPPPSWRRRVKVLLGAACGIKHLHCHAVIHGNVTSSNILLGRSMAPRLSGFGAAARGRWSRPVDAFQTNGYADPEYHRTRLLRRRTDVYGLGVVMLEVLTGKQPVLGPGETLVSSALPSIMAGRLGDVVDRRPAPTPTPNLHSALWRVAETAASCLSVDGDRRLAISQVVENLEEALNLIDTDE